MTAHVPVVDDQFPRLLASAILIAYLAGEMAAGVGLVRPVPPEFAPVATLAAGYLFGRALTRAGS